ncbi:NAD-dependent epimerase/dehydratase family protein [Brevibacillus nitrificans]|uniref:NAD-dependent epimerase/dehydratase family protein n=1 Tax=Brevibacillus nitrificans TaxID=651560 RepID=UPI002607209F|nr:NAD-dependent epimerase/dehydratase family protein [Brevibacillus nitrificans]
MNRVLEEDFLYIAENNVPWDQLDNKTIFITGGTGFLGSLIIRFIDYLNRKQNRNIKMVALVRDEEKASGSIGFKHVTFVEGDMCKLPDILTDIDFIFHCASVTDSKMMIQKPVEVTNGIVHGTINMMNLAYEKKVKSVVYLSSMEVYGGGLTSSKVRETELGTIDIFSPRSCYPMGKRMAENISFNYHFEYGVPVKIARLAQTFGAGVSRSDNRVFAQFMNSVLENKNIVLHTKGESDTNCCYTADAVLALFVLLLKGENGEAYNITNEANHMTIREMAELVAQEVANGAISIKIELEEKNANRYPPPFKLHLSADKLKELGWAPNFSMEQMYSRMIEYVKSVESEK